MFGIEEEKFMVLRVVLDFDGLLLVAEKDQVKKIKLILCHS